MIANRYRHENQPSRAITTVLVDTHSERAHRYADALESAGLTVQIARTFAEAKRMMAPVEPELLIAQVRLAEYNGLHLALWGTRRLPKLRCVIIGASDRALSSYARTCGFEFVSSHAVGNIVEGALKALRDQKPLRRWQRVQVPRLAALVNGHLARVIDVSYGGFRVEVDEASHLAPGAHIALALPALHLETEAVCRWVKPSEAYGAYWCGASLDDRDEPTESWRAWIDELPPRVGPSPAA